MAKIAPGHSNQNYRLLSEREKQKLQPRASDIKKEKITRWPESVFCYHLYSPAAPSAFTLLTLVVFLRGQVFP